ncbi:hypothetical protein MMC18_008087 [Xylographa bjoerkii]|nr:hypothetical protein [Xylographa bjoerkii]
MSRNQAARAHGMPSHSSPDITWVPQVSASELERVANLHLATKRLELQEKRNTEITLPGPRNPPPKSPAALLNDAVPTSKPRATISKVLEEKRYGEESINWVEDNADVLQRNSITRKPKDQLVKTSVQPDQSQGPDLKRIRIKLVFYYVRKGEVIMSRKGIDYNDEWSDRNFARHLKREYRSTKLWWPISLKKIKFVHFITVFTSFLRVLDGRFRANELTDYKLKMNTDEEAAVRLQFDDILQYNGSRTISRFQYLLDHPLPGKRVWTRAFHDRAKQIREEIHAKQIEDAKHIKGGKQIKEGSSENRTAPEEGLIMVKIIETLSTRSISVLLIVGILTSVVVGVIYGVLQSDWPGAFTLATFLVACLALLLAFFSASEYLGLGRLVDDQIDIESGKQRETALAYELELKDVREREGMSGNQISMKKTQS